MKKILIFIILFFNSCFLFSPQKNKQWKHENNFQNTIEKLMRRCLNHQNRLLDEGILDENVILKTHDALKIIELKSKNPHLEHRYKVALKKSRE